MVSIHPLSHCYVATPGVIRLGCSLRFLLVRYTIYKDHITLSDYEINDGMSLEMY